MPCLRRRCTGASRLVTIGPVLYNLISQALLVWAFLVHPTKAECPSGRDLRLGIRRDGHFACWSTPVGDPVWDGTYDRPERGIQRDDALEGRIYCGPGTEPVVLDWRTVACREVSVKGLDSVLEPVP